MCPDSPQLYCRRQGELRATKGGRKGRTQALAWAAEVQSRLMWPV